MNDKIFVNNFPNNLKIARRKVIDDKTIIKIHLNLQKIELVKDNNNLFLKKYLKTSNKIGI